MGINGASAYPVPARDAQAETEVKRSRFLCTLRRVATEEEARSVVEGLRREHWDARHHCSAFVIGPPGADRVERSSDDGEPAGTAGAPMLEVLRGGGPSGEGVADCVAVVTRWFGGTLLGAGGLVRAYGDAVRAALDEAGTRERRLLREVAVELGHADAARVESDLRARGLEVLATSYGVSVELVLGVPPADVGGVEVVLAALTSGAAAPRVAGERWVDG